MTADPNSPQVLTTVANEVEAAAILTALGDYGVHALTTGSYTSGFRAEAPGAIQVIVRSSDLERATLALAEICR